MPRLSDLLPESLGNRWEEVITAWAALLRSETVTPVKRQLARQATEESLMPADLAVILGTSVEGLEGFFVRGKSLKLEEDALVLLKRATGLPIIALRVAFGQLRLSDCVSPSGLGHCQRLLLQQHPHLGAVLDDAQVVALFALLSGMSGDEPGSERRLGTGGHPQK